MSDPASKSFTRDHSHASVVPASRVIRSAEVAHIGGRAVTSKSTPTVELVKEDDIVRAIDVICECGQRIRLWCSYDDNGEPQQL